MRFQTRGFTSLLLSLAFLAISVSGAVLYASPKGRVAYWTNWTLLGLGKESWETIHVNIALLLLLASGFHLYFNWTLFLGYIRAKAKWTLNLKREIVATVLITALIIVGSLVYVPPFSTIMHLNSRIQAYWEQRAPKAPAPHAEEFSLGHLARTIDLSAEEVLEALQQGGFTVEDRSMSLRQLGEKHGVAPSDVYAAIVKHYREFSKARCGVRGGACKRVEQRRSDH